MFVCEGEKDCDNLAAIGLAATTNAGGAEKWKAEHSEALRGRLVFILPDNDEPGRRHASAVAVSLHNIAAGVRIVNLSHLPDKGDVSDWLAAGGTADELLRLANEAPEFGAGSITAAAPETALPPREPFPVDLLPNPVAAYIKHASVSIGCDTSAVALPLWRNRPAGRCSQPGFR